MADIPTDTEGQAAAAPAADAGSGEGFDSRTAAAEGADSADGADEGDGGEEGTEDGEDDGDDDFEDDGAEPTVRDKAYYIGLRHGKKAARKAAEPSDEGEGEDEGDEGEDGIHPDDERVLEKVLSPLTTKLQEQQDQKDLSDFISGNPEFKPFQKRIERFMKHDSRRHLPLQTIAMEAVGYDGMMKMAAKLSRSSSRKKESSGSGPSGGSGKRGAAPTKNAWEMSDTEFAAMQENIRHKR